MTLDAYVKMDTCDGGYFQGDETFHVFHVDVHVASSLQEFGGKKTSRTRHDIKNNDKNNNKKTSTSGD